ncbi:MAG: DNA-protecting protein DprA [Myxococcota bacterium]|nr:DNA-protecting protein DprA [Myxococcota bacterium]
MPPLVHLTPLDPGYPARLRALARPPATLTVRGGPLEAERAVALVGSRNARDESMRFARDLARTLVGTGAVVVSGGATGIDESAHVGALEGQGRTWAVAGTGCNHCFPPHHAELYETIARGPGSMVWPFPPDRAVQPGSFLARNRVLVTLADAVVVVQAGFPSGALRAAECARILRKPLWVVPAPPWLEGYAGTHQLLTSGVRPLTCVNAFLRTLELEPAATPPHAFSSAEQAIWNAMTHRPLHVDQIADAAHVAAHVAAATLLTLALENVVVEGPPGFFRRCASPQALKILG